MSASDEKWGWRELAFMKIRKNIKLAKYTTFHIGGPAKFFAEIKNINELKKAVDFAEENKLKIFILGSGSNTLISDRGINGLVLRINIGGIEIKDTNIYAGAGEIWDKIVAGAVSRGLGGIENLSLIPGTVGGAVYQNIGAYGVEIKEVVKSVVIFDIKSKKIKIISGKDCEFRYRTSIFQKFKGKNYIILGVFLKLSKSTIPNIKYPDLLKEFKGNLPSISEIRQAVIRIRRLKLVYPTKRLGTAGSFFKNPVISRISFKKLIAKYPDIQGRTTNNEVVKLSAGQLIEEAGWKGRKLKNVGVSPKHALVLISYKGATAKNILTLIKLIQDSVKRRYDITLEPEVKIVL